MGRTEEPSAGFARHGSKKLRLLTSLPLTNKQKFDHVTMESSIHQSIHPDERQSMQPIEIHMLIGTNNIINKKSIELSPWIRDQVENHYIYSKVLSD